MKAQQRLLAAIEHTDLPAGLAFDGSQHLTGIIDIAQRSGRKYIAAIDLQLCQHFGKAIQRGTEHADAIFVQPSIPYI